MTLSTPTKAPARRRKIARCTCPACTRQVSPDGAFFCTVDREWAAYASGQYLGAYCYKTHADEALAIYRIDQAAAQAIETAAAAADLEHDIAQSSTDADVVVALNAAVRAANATLPEHPPAISYSAAQGGFVWDGAPTSYNSYTEADLARKAWLQGETADTTDLTTILAYAINKRDDKLKELATDPTLRGDDRAWLGGFETAMAYVRDEVERQIAHKTGR